MQMHPPASTSADAYFDRSRPPAETVNLMRPHFRTLGITRLAHQTGLDRIGIPVYAAFRPNALTIAVNTGKGIEPNAACASAVMEAVEYAIAESPRAVVRQSTPAELQSAGATVVDVRRFLPRERRLQPDQRIAWLTGTELFSGREVLVPRDAVIIDHTSLDNDGFNQSTNGLASGNTQSEAIFHALCELVERDAQTLFLFRSARDIREAALNHTVFGDPVIEFLVGKIIDAGFTLRLFDMTTDVGLPVYKAVIADSGRVPSRHFDVSAGSGCHPVAARAAARAITEAAQTRITTITGARDDFDPLRYGAPFQAEHGIYLDAEPSDQANYGVRVGMPLGTSLSMALQHALAKVRAAGIRSVVSIPLGGEAFGISVVKLLCADLEDRSANRHWRPGRRALRAMMEFG